MQFENVDYLWKVMQDKSLGIKQLTTVESRNSIAKAIFTVTSKKFLKDFKLESARFPEKYHHVYEWGDVGNLNRKLFSINRGTLGNGSLSVNFKFKQSSTNVPVPRALKIMGKSGKSVTRRSIFKNKAEVMESGRPVSFKTKRWIVFLSEGDTGDKVFVRPNRVVNIMNPGGRATTRSFENYILKWYATQPYVAIEQADLFGKLERGVASALRRKNAGPVQARAAIKKITLAIAQDRTRF